MKNKAFKKTLSVFLSLIMVFAYFGAFSVFMPLTAEALPANMNYYVVADAYGTPQWNGNADRWFAWIKSPDYVKIHYPSHIYLDKTETLQSAGYYFTAEWHYGSNSDYRILFGAPIWGDYKAHSGLPSKYYTMTNIFSDYKVDADFPQNGRNILYGAANSTSSDFDLRIVGYGWSNQGSDGFSVGNTRHDKYVLWRNNENAGDPVYTHLFLMGTPSSSYVGSTSEFNTSGGSIGNYGLAQHYSGSWGTDTNATPLFNNKGTGGKSSASAVDCSNYYEYSGGTYWPEMKWNVTVYDKSALKNEINKAADIIDRFAASKHLIVAGNWDSFLSENSQAQNQIIIREQTQSNINSAKNELYNAANALYVGADKSELVTAINNANAIRNASDYESKYSAASRQVLDNAVNAALAASVYTNTPSYHLYTNNDAANLAAADQNEVVRLASDINLARANLVGTLYELTFRFANNTSTVKYVWQGNEVVAPENSTRASDSLYHYTYTWSPAIVSPPTGNVTYSEVLSYENHNWGGWTPVQFATCTAGGIDQRNCITCGYVESRNTDPLAHTPRAPIEKNRIEADCINDGSYVKEVWCEECGNMISSETVVLNANGHSFNELVEANAATCTADGNLAYKTCSVCNLYFAGDAAVNSVDGKATNEDFILDATGHALVHFAANAAKCGIAGNIEYWQCGNCNGYYRDAAATMPTTEAAVVIPALEHSYTAVKHEATCTNGEYFTYTCSNCGDTKTSEEGEPLPHPYVFVNNDPAPTCTADGVAHYECNVCHATKTETAKALGHSATFVPFEDSTCTETGVKAHWFCAQCGTAFEDEECTLVLDSTVVERKAHSWSDWSETLAPTCSAPGTEVRECSVCHKTEEQTKAIDPNAHKWNAYEDLGNGKHTRTCEYDAENHQQVVACTYGEWMTTTKPDCLNAGEQTKTCQFCSGTATQPVAALGHTFGETVAANEATCTAKGNDAYKQCETCSLYFAADAANDAANGAKDASAFDIAMLDHTYATEIARVPSTCKTAGSVTMQCGCGAEQTTALKLDADNHEKLVKLEAKAATCSATGLTEGEMCEACGVVTVAQTETAKLAHTEATREENKTEATCGAHGSYTLVTYCSVCKEVIKEEAKTIPATGEHVYATEIARVPSTCKTAGSVTKQCGCGATETTALKLDANNHEKLVNLEAKAATCSVTGLTEGEMCEACGVVTVAQTETAKLAHAEATREENRTEATCGADGSYTLVTYCSVCDEVIKEEAKTIPATGEHVYATEIARVPSTCKTAGSVTMACGCGAEQTTALELDADNHENLVNLEAKEATCSATGLTEGEMCEACGVVTVAQTATAKLAHTEATREENRTEATCGADGSYTHVTYCSVCKEVLNEEAKTIPATGEHVYATEIARVPSTCKTAGSVTKQCGCGAAETTALELDANNHEKLVKLEAKAATCSATGLTEGEKCEACGVVTVAQTATAKLAHTEATREENKVPATCGADGSYTLVTYCSVCDEELKEEAKVIPATGEHVYATEIARVPSTCKTAGSVTMACGCGATETTALELDADNHEKLVKLEAKAATCSATGLTEGEMCEACGVVTVAQTATAKLAHTEATREENKVPATCGADGSYTLVTYCSVCKEVIKEEAKTIPATGEHVYATEIARVPSTCKTAGSVTMACGCGATETTALELDANNHEKLVKLEAKAATCSATGLTEGEMCEACGVVTVKQTATAKLAHTEATREENRTEATCGKDGSYTLVTYCSVCKEVLKEEAKTIPALTHEWAQDSLLRPTQKADGTWGNGVVTFVCRHDRSHTRTEIVNRADYTAYDEVVGKLNAALADSALSDAARAEIEGILADHEVALNLVAGEQNAVDEAAANMAAEAEKYIAVFTVTFVAADGTVLSEQTVKYGSNAIAPEAPAVSGFVFVGWDKDFTNVRSDLTVTAQYEEGSTHIYLDSDSVAVAIGESKQINAELRSEEEADATLTWSVADSTIATVDANGVVKGLRSGKTTLTVSAVNGLLTEEITVYVYNPGAEYIVELFGTPYGAYVVGDKYFSAFTYFKVKAGGEFKFRFAVNEQINPDALEILVNGEKLALGEDGYFTIDCVYADTKITVSAVGDLGNDEPAAPPAVEGDDCWCHSSNPLLKLFWKILIFFCKLFGVENYHYCECGKAHW